MSYPLITLYTPGTRPDLAIKAMKYNPDAIIIDLEDTVTPDLKPETRAQVAELIPTLDKPPLVRINRSGSCSPAVNSSAAKLFSSMLSGSIWPATACCARRFAGILP